MGDKVTLKINSNVYEGWRAFSISKSIETIASSFRLSVTDNWGEKPWPLTPGDACEVYIDDEQLVSGYIDAVDNALSSDELTIQVSGRDKTADLVDCSVDGQGSQFTGLKFEKLCSILCKPFGITVESEVNTGAVIPSVVVGVGDTIFETLDKRARQKGLLLVVGKNGVLKITTPGKTYAASALLQGINVLTCNVGLDTKDRFSTYKVKAQNGFEENGTGGFETLGRATDANIARYRPLVINGESAMSSADATKRAQYEAITRAARAQTVSISVVGFKQANGELWRENQLVLVDVPAVGIYRQELIISDIAYALDDTGEITTFGLKRKDAFIPAPEVPEKEEISLGDE